MAPPRLSEPLNVAADAQAVETSCDIVKPEARSLLFNVAISLSSISLCETVGTGSCQINSSDGTSEPKYKLRGPISRCVNLNQARAKASANSSGFS